MKYRLSSEPLIFLYTIIFTINYTVLPQLVVEKVCLAKYNATMCTDKTFVSSDNHIKKESTSWWFYLLTVSLLPSVFTVLIWGPITDVIGRRRAMMFVPIVNAIRALVYLINSYYININVAYMLFGSILSCFYGEFQGVVALCYAYLADVTSNALDQRTMRMAFIEASLFFAGIPAGLLSGYLLEKLGFVSVFALNIGINACILLYVIFYLPRDSDNDKYTDINSTSSLLEDQCEDNMVNENAETIERKTKVNGASEITSCVQLFNPFNQFRRVFVVVTNGSCRKIVIPVILSFGFSVCAVYGELVVQTLYLTNQPFVFSPQTIGYYSAVQSAIRGLGVILFTQLSFHVFHLQDFTLIFIGLVSQVVCFVSIGLARSTLTVFLVNISGLGVPVATTTLRSLATKQVTQDNYGTVLASLEAMDAIAGVFSNALTLWTYNLTLHIYSGVTFFALASCATLSGLVLIIAYCLRTND